MLPFGNGRSYGDSCLNNGGHLLATRGLDRFLAFDPETGLIRCEAGVLLSEILSLTVGYGWFLPVTPGTRFVTVGGAIANDVHGKNHHVAGTFGHHVTCLELLRSSGERLRCGPTEHADLFAATIGGLGLTGLITWAEFRLKRIANPYVQVERQRFDQSGRLFRPGPRCRARARIHGRLDRLPGIRQAPWARHLHGRQPCRPHLRRRAAGAGPSGSRSPSTRPCR